MIAGKINRQTLVIIAALALPVVLLAVVIHSGTSKNAIRPRPVIMAHRTLEQERAAVRTRLAGLEKMTPAQWPQEKRIHPWAAGNLQAAIGWNVRRLAQLNAMTPQQWEAQFHPRPPRPRVVPRVAPVPQRAALNLPAAHPMTVEKGPLPPISR